MDKVEEETLQQKTEKNRKRTLSDKKTEKNIHRIIRNRRKLIDDIPSNDEKKVNNKYDKVDEETLQRKTESEY